MCSRLLLSDSSEESGEDILNAFSQPQSQPRPNMEFPFSDVSENDTGSIFGKSSRIKASAVLDYIINKHTFDLNLIMKLFGP